MLLNGPHLLVKDDSAPVLRMRDGDFTAAGDGIQHRLAKTMGLPQGSQEAYGVFPRADLEVEVLQAGFPSRLVTEDHLVGVNRTEVDMGGPEVHLGDEGEGDGEPHPWSGSRRRGAGSRLERQT